MRAAAVALVTALALPAAAQDLTEAQVRALVLDTIRANPEIVMEAVGILQRRDAAEAEARAQETLGTARDRLERDPNAPVAGNPDGDVTVVEFFDYNCPYCRRAADQVAALVDEDDMVRIVYREWPILGEGSVAASRAALAAREQGGYEAIHAAMMAANGRLDEAAVLRIAGDVGLDVDRLRADMDAPEVQAHIDASMALAEELGFTGTPSFVIGDTRAPGLIDAGQMIEAVEAARAAAD